jgi:nitrile hydratase beta subunit
MNGVHDMGGMHGFGPVLPEPNEPVFHAAWERRVFALVMAMSATGAWTIDMARYTREDRSPADYLSKSYYELWLAGLERLVRERDLVSAAELAAGHSVDPPKPLRRVLVSADVAPALARGTCYTRPPIVPARYQIGDRVRATNTNPPGHTRLPRYVRGRFGTVDRIHGYHVFADSSAAGQGENPQWLYAVRFSGSELWGEDADRRLGISIDAFEPYLEPA